MTIYIYTYTYIYIYIYIIRRRRTVSQTERAGLRARLARAEPAAFHYSSIPGYVTVCLFWPSQGHAHVSGHLEPRPTARQTAHTCHMCEP